MSYQNKSVTCAHCKKTSCHQYLRHCAATVDYKCTNCGKTFFVWTNDELNKSSASKDKTSTMIKDMSCQNKSVTCSYCNKTTYHQHLQDFAASADYRCISCGKTFLVWTNDELNKLSAGKDKTSTMIKDINTSQRYSYEKSSSEDSCSTDFFGGYGYDEDNPGGLDGDSWFGYDHSSDD